MVMRLFRIDRAILGEVAGGLPVAPVRLTSTGRACIDEAYPMPRDPVGSILAGRLTTNSVPISGFEGTSIARADPGHKMTRAMAASRKDTFTHRPELPNLVCW